MFRLIGIGSLSALFFSSTFILNRAMSLDGGHWVGSGSLRYAWMLLLTLGTIPFWLVLILMTTPPPPSPGQIINTALVALFSGIIATSLFLHARHLAANAYEIAAIDATQSSEVIFSLLGEIIFLQGALPGGQGAIGVILTLVGLTFYIRAQTPQVKAVANN